MLLLFLKAFTFIRLCFHFIWLQGALGVPSGDFSWLVTCLRAGCDAVQQYGGAREGDRTMLDALLPAVRALEVRRSVRTMH